MQEKILDIRNLSAWYKTYRGMAKVVTDVNLHVNSGEKIGIVGESGCGKTTTMKAILRILDESVAVIPNTSEILFEGENILKMNDEMLQQVRRRKIAMISQAPMAALNPVFTIGQQLVDVIRYSEQGGNIKKGEHLAKSKKLDMLERAKIAISDVMISDPERMLKSYPHQLSGGMRQRICIAMAMVTPRKLIIADEPGTALDVTVQDQIHRLLHTLVEEQQLSLIMITHSLGVARDLVDRIYVMYAGNIVESCDAKELFDNPLHPYTVGLMDCVPRLSGGGLSTGVYGYIPDYINITGGCRFADRCKDCMDICRKEPPPMKEISKGHKVACYKYLS